VAAKRRAKLACTIAGCPEAADFILTVSIDHDTVATVALCGHHGELIKDQRWALLLQAWKQE
jgi:hypothetical protein